MSREVAPRRLSTLLPVAVAATRDEVALGLVAADAEWFDVVQRQVPGRKRTAAVDTPATVPIEDACTRARSRLCHAFYYTDNVGKLPVKAGQSKG